MRQISIVIIFFAILVGCNSSNSKNKEQMNKQVRIIFLHHSTGKNIWRGDVSKLSYKIFKKSAVQKWFSKYNRQNSTNYQIEETYFPNDKGGYGWKNYPYDYYNIWVKHEGDKDYMNEPMLESLTKKYDVIIWKHCYPVCKILPDSGQGDINSEEKRIENYKLQYNKLKEKMHSFPNTKFIVWTGAVLTKESTDPESAQRAKDFFTWVKQQWDEPGDNIFLWDLYELETEGGLYFKDEYASTAKDPHPSVAFSTKVYPFFCKRITDVIEGRGDSASITGK